MELSSPGSSGKNRVKLIGFGPSPDSTLSRGVGRGGKSPSSPTGTNSINGSMTVTINGSNKLLEDPCILDDASSEPVRLISFSTPGTDESDASSPHISLSKSSSNRSVSIASSASSSPKGVGNNVFQFPLFEPVSPLFADRRERLTRLAKETRDWLISNRGFPGNSKISISPNAEENDGDDSASENPLSRFVKFHESKLAQAQNRLLHPPNSYNSYNFNQNEDRTNRSSGYSSASNSSSSSFTFPYARNSECENTEMHGNSNGHHHENEVHGNENYTGNGNDNCGSSNNFNHQHNHQHHHHKNNCGGSMSPNGTFDSLKGFKGIGFMGPGLGIATRTYISRSTKSTFEYSTYSSTYKYCTERMTQSYHESYDAVSESDDDEDEEDLDLDTVSNTRSSSECGSVSEVEGGRFSPKIVSKKDEDGTQLELNGTTLTAEQEAKQRQVILGKIAAEFVATERTYVDVLHLIDQVFQFRVDNENRAHNMFPPEVVTHMFANIKSIYKLHHDFLLPQLDQRLQHWDEDQRLGDITKNFAPFLKMYTEYVRNFDNAMNTINVWITKSHRFAAIVDDIQKMPECRNLTLQHHMLCPVQRIPRYQLLLRDYLKKLSPDSPDRSDAQKSLELVSAAAQQANDALKKISKFKKLLEVQESLGGTIDLVSPTRELVKEGKIIKISARSGDHQERYLFLFNDLLLLCSPRLMVANRVVSVSGPNWKVRAKLDVQGMEVLEGDNLETANTFYVCSNQKSIELYTSTLEEKECWMEALGRTIQDLGRRKSSLKVVGSDTPVVKDVELGKRPPSSIRAEGIAFCSKCNQQFSAFRRRHQCRACGEVVCHKCSCQKVALPYAENKLCRVCRNCYVILVEINSADIASTHGIHTTLEEADEEKENHSCATSPTRRRGVLEVKACDENIIGGFLLLKTRGRERAWSRRYFALHDDFVLYSFKTDQDDYALTSTPLPGLTVSLSERGSDGTEPNSGFKLSHKKKTYWFQAKDAEEAKRWVTVLDKASRAEPLS